MNAALIGTVYGAVALAVLCVALYLHPMSWEEAESWQIAVAVMWPLAFIGWLLYLAVRATFCQVNAAGARRRERLKAMRPADGLEAQAQAELDREFPN